MQPESTTDAAGDLLNVRDVAAMLRCSPQTVRRLANAGVLPEPVRLGGLVRWPRPALLQWIKDGCPRVRPPRVR